MRGLCRQVKIVAPTGSTALILGETGTGKELIARAIHNLSPRRKHPFIKVNCAAIPAGLIESELFGHERGAFTGAVSQRTGRFEMADGGTLFLSTKLMTSLWSCSRNCCACSKSRNLSELAALTPCGSTYASWRQRAVTYGAWSPRANSGPTCIIASNVFPLCVRLRCGNGRKTFRS